MIRRTWFPWNFFHQNTAVISSKLLFSAILNWRRVDERKGWCVPHPPFLKQKWCKENNFKIKYSGISVHFHQQIMFGFVLVGFCQTTRRYMQMCTCKTGESPQHMSLGVCLHASADPRVILTLTSLTECVWWNKRQLTHNWWQSLVDETSILEEY